MNRLKQYNIRLTEEEIKNSFKHHLVGKHADLLGDAIFGLLDSEWKIERLFKASMGMKEECKYPIGSIFTVEISSVSTYHCDTDKMKDAGIIVDDMINATLIRFNPWNNSPFHVEYQVLDNDGISTTKTYDLYESQIQLAEVFPEHLNTNK